MNTLNISKVYNLRNISYLQDNPEGYEGSWTTYLNNLYSFGDENLAIKEDEVVIIQDLE